MEPSCPKDVRDIPAAGGQSAEVMTLVFVSKHRKLILSQLPRLEDVCSRQHQAAGIPEDSLGSEVCLWGGAGSMGMLYPLQTSPGTWPQTPGTVLPSPAWGPESSGSHLIKQNWAKSFFPRMSCFQSLETRLCLVCL